jgi:ABC-type multidrug transport system fused ATPase/permease subunit
MINDDGSMGDEGLTDRAKSGRAFIWSQVRFIVGRLPGSITLLVIASVLAAFAEGGILAILAQSALLLVKHADTVRLDIGGLHLEPSIGQLLAAGCVLAVVRLALQVVIAFVPARIYDRTQVWIRRGLFDAFTSASWNEQSRDKEGHLQELITNHANAASQNYMTVVQLIVALMTFVVLVVSALALNSFAALAVCVVAAVLLLILRPLATLGGRYASELSTAWLGFAAGINESVRLAEETHVFGTGPAQRKQLEDLIAAMRKPNLLTQWLGGFIPGAYQSLIYLMLVLGLLGLYETGTGQIASLGAVVLLLVRSGAYGQQTQSCVQALHQTRAYVERIQAAEQRYLQSIGAKGEQPLKQIQTLACADVSYAYPGRQVALSGIDFEVAGGEAVGIIGPSGAGKSTLVQILLGLRQPTSGQYLVNGLPADRVNEKDWRRLFAYVPQEPRLLHATVADNIRFFRDLPRDAVERAARLAGIHHEVISWPNKYETIVGPRADAISGGQQQRICLARALAADPEVLVLDEPTSALDPGAEQLIQQSLEGLKHRLTLFVVAHRMSTLDICERVMVIVDGRLDAIDSIPALREVNPYYRSAVAGSGRSHSSLLSSAQAGQRGSR